MEKNENQNGVNEFESHKIYDENEEKLNKNSLAKSLLENFETLIIAVLVAFLVFTFGFRLCTVDGSSMYDTLSHGDKLITSNLGYSPERGDIIVFHMTGENSFNEPLVKRVIATEGEWVDINFETWEIKIADNSQMNNAIIVDQPYIHLEGVPLSSNMKFPVQVPEGHLFVLGDNRNKSSDSRSAKIGFVDERRVLGKVLFRVSPFEKIEN